MTEMSEQNRRRIKRLVESCSKAIRAQQMQGHEGILFSALLSRRSKKLNSIDRAAVDNASRLLRDYINSEDPDKVRVELRGTRDELLWSKTFSLEVDDGPLESSVPVFQGLGEAELGELVNAKIQEMRRQDELRDLRVQRDQLEQENEQLRRQLEEAEESLEAKKSVEYYSGIIGIALPGLARILSGSPLGSTLGLLAGVSGMPEGGQTQGGDESSLMIEEIGQFTRSLDHQQLAKLYMVVAELSNNRELIGSVLSYITGLDHKQTRG